MADEAADRAIKTVKGISAKAWENGLKAAQKRGEPFGVWLARAIERQADLERGDRVILPDERPQPAQGLPQSAPAGLPPAEGMVALTEMMRAAHAVSEASGVPVPKTAARHFFAVLIQIGRAARGQTPGRHRPRIGQTSRQVIDAAE